MLADRVNSSPLGVIVGADSKLGWLPLQPVNSNNAEANANNHLVFIVVLAM